MSSLLPLTTAEVTTLLNKSTQNAQSFAAIKAYNAGTSTESRLSGRNGNIAATSARFTHTVLSGKKNRPLSCLLVGGEVYMTESMTESVTESVTECTERMTESIVRI
jgi:hypothetical protein